jgi:hypothetical protein
MGNHIASLRAILEVSEENVQNSSPENATRFTTILAGCNEVLQDLQGLFDEYEKLPVASQVTWERMEWRAADLADLKARLDTNVGLLDAFNSSISL